MLSLKKSLPERAVSIVEKEIITEVYDIGPHCSAAMFVIPCIADTNPKAIPKIIVNVEAVPKPPTAKRQTAATRQVTALKINADENVLGVLLVYCFLVMFAPRLARREVISLSVVFIDVYPLNVTFRTE